MPSVSKYPSLTASPRSRSAPVLNSTTARTRAVIRTRSKALTADSSFASGIESDTRLSTFASSSQTRVRRSASGNGTGLRSAASVSVATAVVAAPPRAIQRIAASASPGERVRPRTASRMVRIYCKRTVRRRVRGGGKVSDLSETGEAK